MYSFEHVTLIIQIAFESLITSNFSSVKENCRIIAYFIFFFYTLWNWEVISKGTIFLMTYASLRSLFTYVIDMFRSLDSLSMTFYNDDE